MPFDRNKPALSQTYGDMVLSTLANLIALFDEIVAHEADGNAHGLAPLIQERLDSIAHRADGSAHGLGALNATVTAQGLEVATARGAAPTLAQRLAMGLNADGTPKLANLASKWITPGDVPTYLSATTFSVPGDRRLVFIAGAVLRCTVSGAYVYASVASSAFGAGVTTVTLDPAYPVLTAGLSALDLSLIAFDNSLASALATEQNLRVAMATQISALQYEVVPEFKNGAPMANEVLLRFVVHRPFTIPINAAGSQFKGAVAATGATTFSLQKNGVAFGTAGVAAGQATGAFTVAAATAFVAGDLLTLVAPAAPDATLANIAFTLRGILQ